MSLHESILIGLVFILMTGILWKWSKVMLLIVNLEMISALILTSIFISSLLTFMILIILLFFVSEALIMLSALFSQMRELGMTYSVISFW